MCEMPTNIFLLMYYINLHDRRDNYRRFASACVGELAPIGVNVRQLRPTNKNNSN